MSSPSPWRTLPNLITIGRVAAVPVLIVLLYLPAIFESLPGEPFYIGAAVFFGVVGFSDLIDGWLARRMHVETALGRYLDPLADKLLIAAMLVMLVWLGRIPAWMAIVVISRELWVTGLRAMAMEHGLVVASDIWGKSKTLLQLLTVGMLIWHYPIAGVSMQTVGWWLMWPVMLITLWSGLRYTWSFKNLLLEK